MGVCIVVGWHDTRAPSDDVEVVAALLLPLLRRKRSRTSRKAQPCESTCSGSYRNDLFQNALPDAGFERSLHDEVYLHAKKFGQVAP
jgi:hypothetical protein